MGNPTAVGPLVDAETGFQYLRARYYDPGTGQFLTRDPIEAVTREPYGYVGGNPLNVTDPLGLCWGPGCWLQDAVGYVDDHKVGILKGTSWVLAGGAIVATPFTGGASLSTMPVLLAAGSGGTAIAAEALDPKPDRAQRVTLAAGLTILGGGVGGAFGEGALPVLSAANDPALLGYDIYSTARGQAMTGADCVGGGGGSW